MANKEIKETEIEKVEENLEHEYHVSWYIIVFKAIAGILEVLVGTGVLLLGRPAFLIYRTYLSEELLDETNGLIARIAATSLPYIFSHRSSLSLYLILLGVAKIAGAIGLIYKKHWGVDLLVGLTLIMLPFQLVQFARRPSWLDFGYIMVGLLIALYLINFSPRVWAKRMVKNARRKKS